MTRFITISYALATILAWGSVPAVPATPMETVVMAQAQTEDAALQAAWDHAQAELDSRCQELGGRHTALDGGMESVSPTATGYLVEVYAGGTCS